jgi:hypothetical protein
MALKNSFLLIFLIASSISLAKTYPELMAKQSNDNIRFISHDGKFTYYQKRSGSLHFSTNYKVQDVLKAPIGTQYVLSATPTRKKILIYQSQNFHTFLSLRMKQKIFLVNYGEGIAREVGDGISPRLQFNDNWISYYDPAVHTIYFEETSNGDLRFAIKLNNRINPYFVPEVVMTDENTVYYTDLGENGNPGLVVYKRSLATSELIKTLQTVTSKIEIAKCKNNLIYGEFGIMSSGNGTIVSSLSLPINDNKLFLKTDKIYSSDLDDIGHLSCDFESDEVYFVKNYGNKTVPSYDIADLNYSDKTLTRLTDLKSVTTIVNMDGALLSMDRGKYLFIKNEADYKTTDMLKAKSKDSEKAKDEKTKEDKK